MHHCQKRSGSSNRSHSAALERVDALLRRDEEELLLDVRIGARRGGEDTAALAVRARVAGGNAHRVDQELWGGRGSDVTGDATGDTMGAT
jgi:hypothetical protein